MTSDKAYTGHQRLDDLANTYIGWTTACTFPGTNVTAASYTNLCAGTVPANDADLNSIYELEVWGTGTQGSVGNRQTLSFRVAFASFALQAVTIGTTAFEDTGNKTFSWKAVARVSTDTGAGASSNWYSYLYCQTADTNVNITPTASPGVFAVGFGSDGASGQTVDTTVDRTLNVQAQWGATTGSPSMTSRVALFRRIA